MAKGHALHMETEAAKTLIAHLHDLRADDEDTVRDSIEGETNLHEAIADAVRQIGEDEAAIASLTDYIAALSARKDRLKERVETTREAIAVSMGLAHLKTMETPYGTVTLRRTPQSLVVVDETAIPYEYWKPQPPKLDRSGLLKALKEKRTIPGAELSNGGETISVRRD